MKKIIFYAALIIGGAIGSGSFAIAYSISDIDIFALLIIAFIVVFLIGIIGSIMNLKKEEE